MSSQMVLFGQMLINKIAQPFASPEIFLESVVFRHQSEILSL